MAYHQSPNLNVFDLKNFNIETLTVQSNCLKGNPLKDTHIRHNPVLVSKSKGPHSVVLVLAGFTGSGPKYFNYRSFEQNMAQEIDSLAGQGLAPKALYVFVEAMTFWGGGQFINSPGAGRYEDFIVKDLLPAIRSSYDTKPEASNWCVMGGSSGGYGALHLTSKHPASFGLGAAIAPDSFFERSLLPDIYQAVPYIEKAGGIKAVAKEIRAGRGDRIRKFHSVVNAIGMASCYSGSKTIRLPVDMNSGELDKKEWKSWVAHDPLTFLPRRSKGLKKVKRLFLDVGTKDQFNLQFGTRQIKRILKEIKVPLDYSEFEGNHFDLSGRRPEVWRWLVKQWKK